MDSQSTIKRHGHDTRNDLDHHVRGTLITLLNVQLADTFDLYGQTKVAHWNVKGAQFFQLHELFDRLAGQVLQYVDLIAERAMQLGDGRMGRSVWQRRGHGCRSMISKSLRVWK